MFKSFCHRMCRNANVAFFIFLNHAAVRIKLSEDNKRITTDNV